MNKCSQSDKRALLAQHFLFRQMNPADIDRILALSVERRFNDCQTIFQKGDEGASMMIVLEGRVLISAVSEEGKELTLNYIEPGEILGEVALIDGKKRSANATAIGTCTLLCIMRSEFIPFVRKNSELAIQLLTVLCEKLRNTSDMIENVGLLPIPARLARLVLKLARPEDETLSSGLTFELRMSQREIGNLIGATRESVNKTLSQWQTQGLIRLQQPLLTILKPKELGWISETAF